MHIGYRLRQFWNAIFDKPTRQDFHQVESFLSPELMSLYREMHPSEQAHSIRIYHRLLESGENDNDLLTAALLHDVGKTYHALHLWERIIIVLGNKLFPKRVEEWGKSEPFGWKRPFVIAKKHPAWGAEMVAQAGANSKVVRLVERHQEVLPEKSSQHSETVENQLLRRLQALDNTN
jgi:putative nucleotidyltransferase with HDIG domain